MKKENGKCWLANNKERDCGKARLSMSAHIHTREIEKGKKRWERKAWGVYRFCVQRSVVARRLTVTFWSLETVVYPLVLDSPTPCGGTRPGRGGWGTLPGIFYFLIFAPLFYHAPYFTINFEELVQEILLHISFAPTFYFIFLVNWNLGGGGWTIF